MRQHTLLWVIMFSILVLCSAADRQFVALACQNDARQGAAYILAVGLKIEVFGHALRQGAIGYRTRAIIYASTYCPSRNAKRTSVPSITNPNFL